MAANEILVVKLGGGAGLDMPRACADLARIARQRPLVVVHGVSERMNQMCADLAVPVQTIISPNGHSSRYTDPRTRDIFASAARSVNHELVEWLSGNNVHAFGLHADHDIALQGERKDAIRAVVNGRVRIVRDDYSGTINGVDGAALRALLSRGHVPVVPPMAMSSDGLLNVDGDRAAAAIARALGAETLIILSNVRGLYRDFSDQDSFVRQVSLQQLPQAMQWAEGRMKRKVLGAQEALEGGVRQVIIADGRVNQAVSQALLGEGTVFTA